MDLAAAPTNIALSNGRSRSPGITGEHVFGPCVQCPRPLVGETVTLVDGGDTAELRRLMSEKLIDGDRVEAEPRERGGAGPPQVVQAPRDERCGFRGGRGLAWHAP